MDNYNALSKSAILTKLALDGYFIDLLTLNSFIKSWQIEAIYENEFGIEFFDNSSYLTILDNLKDKYKKTKDSLEGNLKEQFSQEKHIENIEKPSQAQENNNKENVSLDALIDSQKNVSQDSKENINVSLNDITETQHKEAPALSQSVTPIVIQNEEQKETIDILNACDAVIEAQDIKTNENTEKTVDNDIYIIEDDKTYSLEELAKETQTEYQNKTSNIIYENTIMPMAMRNLKPGPVAPNSNINVDHENIEILSEEDFDNQKLNQTAKLEYDDELAHILEGENFSQEEIEKADNLINNSKNTQNAVQNHEAASNTKEEQKPQQQNQAEKTKDELDLMQLAQSFAQNLTGTNKEEIPPADLETIFEESYTEPFEELQNFVQDKPEEYKSLQEDLPSDIEKPETPVVSSIMQGYSSTNLTAQDVRDIIREEITRQTANVVPVAQNNENIKEIVREIVKQTADVAPQNAFKLDISNRTLDMIAKTIAKKIAVKLNEYYKLNSSKQDAKLQLFRERTMDLKEKYQALAEENRKLKNQLIESNRNLNSYKPTVFGLFKYEGKRRR